MIDGILFTSFIENTLRSYILEQTVGILDNARTHHTLNARDMLENIFNGNYYYSPPYSPNLKPIEKGFKQVKEWIRDHENEALRNPVEYINRAFHLFSIQGERSATVFNFWRDYYTLYNNYNLRMNINYFFL